MMTKLKRELAYFRPFHWFAVLVISTWILLLVIGAWWLLYPYNPVNLNTDKIGVVTPVVEAGNNATFNMDFTKNTTIRPHISYYLVDGTVVELKQSTVNRPMGEQQVSRNIYIPVHTPAGSYHLQVEMTYEVNPLRTIEVVWESEQFEVLEYNGRDK